jgi:chorismate dehydratase
MIRLSVVSYLNTAPFLYGLEKSGILKPGLFKLSLDIPSVCAEKLINGKADIGLVPTAILPLLPSYSIIGNTCIGAIGKVDSVMLFSQVPLEEIEIILLDYQSRTSIKLSQILAKNYWKIYPKYEEADKEYISKISGNTAGIVIGDRAFEVKNLFKYQHDLSEAWYNYQHLPFVFACWASILPMNDEIVFKLEEALQFGINHLPETINNTVTKYPSYYPIENYLTQRISYNLDEQKLKGLETFLTLLGKFDKELK